EQQRLLRLGKADLPWAARVGERSQRRGAGAAFVAGDRDMVGARLRDTRSHGADTDLGDQLDRDARSRVHVLQIVDELRQVLDRVDIVVRRRADEAHAGCGVARLADDLVDLVTGQLPAFAGLGALGHLDLDIVGIDEIFGGDAETTRGDLLDRRAHRVAVIERAETLRILAALAGVRLPADAVHRQGQRGVRFPRD